MDLVQKFIQALASILWPLIVIFLLWRYRAPISAVFDSAKSRKFTIKIGGQELTMEEANQVQQNLIADLQNQVSELQKRFDESGLTTQAVQADSVAPSTTTMRDVLWVDDNPKNNAYFIQQLQELKVHVDLATSTAAGIKQLENHHYDHVISDMGRMEGITYNGTAGLDLLRWVKEHDPQSNFILFCSSRAVKQYGEKAKELGADAITSSPTVLSGLLNLGDAEKPR